MATVTSGDGQAIVTHDLGGDGPFLVFAHAAGFHGRVWLPVATHLRPWFHCVSFDARGHGDSEAVHGTAFDWESMAGDALAVAAGLGERPLGVGHSSGASLLLLAEAIRPGTFAALYCIEPIGVTGEDPVPPAPDHPMAVRARRRREVFPSRSEAEQLYRSKPPLSGLAPESLQAYVEHGFADLDDGTVRLRCRPENEARVYEHGMSHDAFRRLRLVTCPVVVARGGRSETIDDDIVRRWASRLPSGRWEVLEGLGHLAPLEDPAAVAAAVVRAFAPS